MKNRKVKEKLPLVDLEVPPEISHQQSQTRLAGPCIQRLFLS